MALKMRLSRGGAKKRPFYRIVVAEDRAPRDGRYIERLGTYNPMLPKDHAERVKLVEDRIQYWLGQGAQPTDRVARFLGEAKLAPMPAQGNNPQKAQPKEKAQERVREKEEKLAAKKEAEAQAAEEAKAAEAATAEAPAEEAAPEASEAPAEVPAEDAPAAEAEEEKPAE